MDKRMRRKRDNDQQDQSLHNISGNKIPHTRSG